MLLLHARLSYYTAQATYSHRQTRAGTQRRNTGQKHIQQPVALFWPKYRSDHPANDLFSSRKKVNSTSKFTKKTFFVSFETEALKVTNGKVQVAVPESSARQMLSCTKRALMLNTTREDAMTYVRLSIVRTTCRTVSFWMDISVGTTASITVEMAAMNSRNSSGRYTCSQ